MIACPICGTPLELDEVDERQEWCSYEYHCEECGNSPSRTVVYKTQSSMVEFDEWDYSEEHMEQLRDEYEIEVELANPSRFGGDTGIDADYF